MKWSRTRTASIFAVGTASALLLTACSSSTTPKATTSAPAGAKVTLTVAYWGDFGLKTLKPIYEKANPGVTLKLSEGEYNAQHENLQQKLIAGSGAPDVAAVDEGFVVQFSHQAGSFVNLLDKGFGKYESKYLKWKWNQMLSADKKVDIGAGTDVGGLAMCYRKDLLTAAGMPSDRAAVSKAIGASWDDFITFGKEYVAKTHKKLIDNATNVFNPILGQQAVGFFTPADKLAMDGGPKVAFETTEKIIDAGLSAGIAAFSPEWDAGFLNGDFAMLACPAWMMGHIKTVSPTTSGKWDIADIPGPGGNWGGSFWTIPAQGKNIDAAYKLVEWLIQPAQQIEIFNTVGNLPSQPALYADPAIKDKKDPFFNNAPIGQIFSKTALDIKAIQYLGSKNGPVRVAVENVLADIQAGNVKTGADAWAAAVAGATAAAK